MPAAASGGHLDEVKEDVKKPEKIQHRVMTGTEGHTNVPCNNKSVVGRVEWRWWLYLTVLTAKVFFF